MPQTARHTHASALTRCLLATTLSCTGLASAQVVFEETFTPPGGCTAPVAPWMPEGWTRFNVDNRTPTTPVNYVNQAWIVREDFGYDTTNCAAFSTSWYSPAGAANDFMCTPAVTIPAGARLRWRAITYDALYPDGYEVRVMTSTPTGGPGNIGNLLTDSTVVFSTGAEASEWTPRTTPLSAYAGQALHICFRNNSTDKFLVLIDDVVVETVVTFDPALTGLSTSQYTEVPAFLALQESFTATIKNSGEESLSNLSVEALPMIDGQPGTPVTSPPLASLASQATSNVTLDGLVLDQPGTWVIDAVVSAAEGDELPGNSTQSVAYTTVTTGTYSRNSGPTSGHLGIGANNGGELGQSFDIPTLAKLESVRFVVANNDATDPPDGTGVFDGVPLQVNVRAMTAGNLLPSDLIASASAVVPAGVSGEVALEASFGGLLMQPGRYVFTVVEPVPPPGTSWILQLHQTTERFRTGTVWVTWPTIPGGGWSNVETFGANVAKTFRITPVLSAATVVPVARDDRFVVAEDTALSGDVGDNDDLSDAGGNVWSVVTPPSSGTLTLDPDGRFDYQPAAGFSGEVSFRYALCDVDDRCAEADTSILVRTLIFADGLEPLPPEA